MKTEPQSVAQTAFTRRMSPYPKGDPRYTATPGRVPRGVQGRDARRGQGVLEGVVRRVERRGRVRRRLRRGRDLRAARGALRIVEEPEPVHARPERFHGRPGGHGPARDAGQGERALPRGTEPRPASDDDPDYPALLLANYMFGGGFLNSRLAVRIRQKEGLSYGVGSGLDGATPGRGGPLHGLRDPRAAEHGEARGRRARGDRARPQGRLHGRRGRGREIRVAAGPAGEPLTGRRARRPPPAAPLPRPHARVGRRAREEGLGPDARAGRGRRSGSGSTPRRSRSCGPATSRTRRRGAK